MLRETKLQDASKERVGIYLLENHKEQMQKKRLANRIDDVEQSFQTLSTTAKLQDAMLAVPANQHADVAVKSFGDAAKQA